MSLLLRKSSIQARIEGREPSIWPDDDFAIVDADIPVGRAYRELVCGEPKWRWSIHQIPEAGPGRPIAPPHNGHCQYPRRRQGRLQGSIHAA
jgi:hypothetical protein